MGLKYEPQKAGVQMKNIQVHPEIHDLINVYRSIRGCTFRAGTEQLLKMGLAAARMYGFLDEVPRDDWNSLFRDWHERFKKVNPQAAPPYITEVSPGKPS